MTALERAQAEAEWRKRAMRDARDALACGDADAAWLALNRHEPGEPLASHNPNLVSPSLDRLTDEEIELAASALEFASTYALQPDLKADALAAKLDSGVAPKGEQEENLRAMYDAWKLLYAVNGSRMVGYVANAQTILRDQLLDYDPFLQKHDLPELVSPPPDRLTPEERTAVLAAVEFFLASTDGRHEAESGATHSGYAKLARLSGREPE